MFYLFYRLRLAVIGLAEEYKHLVRATHSDDADFHSVVKLVQQGYKMRRSDWENREE